MVYKNASVRALDGISLDIQKGDIFGLLGPNGAGKTTTINILCGLLEKTSGEIGINGWELPRDMLEIKKDIGIVPQDIALYPALTSRENLRFIGNMYGIEKYDLNQRIGECLQLMGLANFADRSIKTFSGGMKRRVNLIAGILHKPKILFLDEPTVGIDVQSRTLIAEHLKSLNKEGTTIVYTSHHMEEAENLCSQIAIIDHGRLIASGSPQEMINSKEEYKDLESIYLHLTGKNLRDS
jgi:ABC-2 type transport system ATP-binding protein